MECFDYNEYQRKCLLTAVYPATGAINYPAVGLLAEIIEYLQANMKYRTKDTRETRENCLLELGDCLWFTAVLASDLDTKLSTIFVMAEEETQGDFMIEGLSCLSLIAKNMRDGDITDKAVEDLCSMLAMVVSSIETEISTLGSTVEEVANKNIEKLAARKAKGTLRGSGDHR